MKFRNQKLTLAIIGAALVAITMIASCSKSSSGGPTGPTPPSNPGGYDSANQIAGLSGYWSFNGTLFDSANHVTGASTGTTFTAGPIAGTQALQGNANGAFVLYSGIGSTIPSMTSYTLSFWMNSAQVTNGAQALFQLMFDSAAAGGWPYLDVDAEGYNATSDSLNVKIYFFNDKNAWAGWSFQVYLDTAVGKWTHVAFTYNSANSTIQAYQNGVAVGMFNFPYGPSQSPPTTVPGPLTVYGDNPGAATGNPMAAPLWGAPNFSATTGIIFDNWQTSTTPNSAPGAANGPLGTWAVPYQGSLYHFRVYNTALSASDVNSLYILEKAGF